VATLSPVSEHTVDGRATTSDLVRAEMATMLPYAQDVAAHICDHPRATALYPELLCLLHHTIRASVPLMELAARRAEELAAVDPAAAELVPYLRQHAIEEHDHDNWVLTDYRALGLDPSEILRRPPSETVAALVGAVYYWTLHYHPTAILGYMAVLEGTPPTVELIDRLIASTGYPRVAFHTLLHHAEIDPHHGQDLWDLLDLLPLDEDQIAVIVTTALHTLDLLVEVQLQLLGER
jgi:hypothetical protein